MTVRAAGIGLLTAISVVAGAGVSPSIAAPPPGAPDRTYAAALPTPLADPFYKAPPNLDKKRNGEILATRERPIPNGLFNVRAFQLKFRSTDLLGKPIAAVTSIMVPNGKAANGPLLSYQDIVNATGLKCAPSQVMWDPELTPDELPMLNVVLQRGWTVAIPDHLGPRSSYGAAKLGGQITLDGILAAKQFAPAGVRHSRVTMAGYSGGGMATAWAAALAPSYAPGLKLAGAAYGGVPMNLIKMAEGLGYDNPHPAFGLAFAAAIGMSREYPEAIPMRRYLSPTGKQMYNDLSNACTKKILDGGAWRSAKAVAIGGRQIFNDRTARRKVEENSLSLYRGIPKTPIFEWHSPTDVLIPVSSIDYTIRRYCRAGVRVETLLAPTPDHMTAAAIGFPIALGWLQARFDGRPAPSNC